MNTRLLFGLAVLLMSTLAFSCEKSEAYADSPLLGYWKFDGHPATDTQAYLRVPNDEGLDVMEKSQMIELRADGTYRVFQWSWCGTPPSYTGWYDGTWEQVSDMPLTIKLSQNGYDQLREVAEVTNDQLLLRYLY
ncbi:hypothetical protein [Phaeodactylibacter luteus]|uniref:Lipocalin-like domain-containing protein n=1 Tax=Phaeodactylibacter luteus TaxID=1564516 RepID=A0A5C6RW16_9BACT|nr:hypothetical protein [Phaeodactylibacter luteus]TXB65562.1 hypothetical protein FRY97_06165 [Phaeodactylibacter luteus]